MEKKNEFHIGKENVYRVIDGLYRIHEDLFHIEDEISRFTSASLTTSQLRTNGFMGALVAGLFAIAPILVAVLDIEWLSTPAISVYLIVIAVVILWIYLAFSARSTRRKLGFIAGSTYRVPLERRHDYLQETIATWGNRKRVIDEVIGELEAKIGSAGGQANITDARQRLTRYQEISSQCIEWINWAVEASEQCLNEGQRSKEEHGEILDWAKPFIKEGN